MKINFADPVLLVCLGIILLCSILLVLALKKWKSFAGVSPDGALSSNFDDPEAEVPADLPEVEQEPAVSSVNLEPERPVPPLPRVPVASAAPQGSALATKEVADRLEAMTQRLNEMQSVLNRQIQTTVVAGAATPGALGQGFTPESVDKLLKIVGNVIQQVEILQKGLNLPPRPTSTASVLASGAPTFPKAATVPPVAGAPGSQAGSMPPGNP